MLSRNAIEPCISLLVVQVRELLHKRIRDMYIHPQFTTDVMKPLRMEMLMDQEVKNLSGGELQRVAITLALGTPADVYLIDEPSAYLDSEQRIIAAKVGRALLPRMCKSKVGGDSGAGFLCLSKVAAGISWGTEDISGSLGGHAAAMQSLNQSCQGRNDGHCALHSV